MKFVYRAYHVEISSEELIADLKRVQQEKRCESLSMAEYDQIGKYNSSTVSRRFGTWNNALKKAGIGIRNEFWDETALYENIQSVWIAKGEQPTRRDMDEHPLSHISSGTYLRRFGKWSTALMSFVDYINDIEEPSSEQKTFSCEGNSHKTKRDINNRLRFLVLSRDNFTCCACGASPAKDGGVTQLHIDHIIPWSRGGETVIENLQTLCSDCNLGKSNLLPED